MNTDGPTGVTCLKRYPTLHLIDLKISHNAPKYNGAESTTATNRSNCSDDLIFLFATTKGKLPYLFTVLSSSSPKDHLSFNKEKDILYRLPLKR